MNLIEASKRALEALEYAHATCKYENERQSKAIAGLREAIAEAEKTEPVARVVHRIIEAGHDTHQATSFDIKWLHVNPLEWPVVLYASPPPAQPISHNQPHSNLPPLPMPARKQGHQMEYDGCDKAFFDCFDPDQMEMYAKEAVRIACQMHADRIAELESEVVRFRADAMNERSARQSLEQQLAARAPLTDEQIAQACDKVLCIHPTAVTTQDIARAIEAAHGITKGST